VKGPTTETTSQDVLPSPINWYPGHMAKAQRRLLEKLRQVDLVWEVRDARLPLTSGNEMLQRKLGLKARLIVLNKTDLADPENVRLWTDWFRRRGEPFMFIDSGQAQASRRLVAKSRDLMAAKRQRFMTKGIKPPPLRLMVVGLPNTGKSTLINRLLKKKAVPTGAQPGVTRGESWLVLAGDLELLDTPGVMPPRIDSEEQGLCLCAIHALKDEIVGKERIAHFLVGHLLVHGSSVFRDRYGLPAGCLEVQAAVERIGRHLNFLKQGGEIDSAKTCDQVLSDFRRGWLGVCSFESPPPL